ncbi:MAG: hypothetical protein IT444_10250 [Phycisphaeraceae bacterium]|nr:hypothetical protein [Phycisphaeraceae bacterium]
MSGQKTAGSIGAHLFVTLWEVSPDLISVTADKALIFRPENGTNKLAEAFKFAIRAPIKIYQTSLSAIGCEMI